MAKMGPTVEQLGAIDDLAQTIREHHRRRRKRLLAPLTSRSAQKLGERNTKDGYDLFVVQLEPELNEMLYD